MIGWLVVAIILASGNATFNMSSRLRSLNTAQATLQWVVSRNDPEAGNLAKCDPILFLPASILPGQTLPTYQLAQSILLGNLTGPRRGVSVRTNNTWDYQGKAVCPEHHRCPSAIFSITKYVSLP